MEMKLGAVHKLRLQEEGGRWSKNSTLVNFYTIKNVNGGGSWSTKEKSLNVVCERPLIVPSACEPSCTIIIADLHSSSDPFKFLYFTIQHFM